MEFMDGVTLIEECTAISTTGYMIMILSIISLSLSIGISKISKYLAYKSVGFTFAFVFLLVGMFGGLRFVLNHDEFQEPNGKYEVTVSGNVNMNEFQSKYDIIDYDNGVYTVKPKDNVTQPS